MVRNEMIPKKIHYCWFGGGPLPKQAKKCIQSWKQYCPDYQIVEWNETNFNLDAHPYLKFCYDNKKWAFLSDYVRLSVVAEYGGIYFDTDVEVIQSLDYLLEHEAFYSFEDDENINTGQGFGSVANHKIILAMKEEYEQLIPDTNGNFPIIKCPQLNTQALVRFGLELNGLMQNIQGAIILPKEYMNPYDDPTGILKKTKNTVSIHWYSKSWMSKRIVWKSKILKPIRHLLRLLYKTKNLIQNTKY